MAKKKAAQKKTAKKSAQKKKAASKKRAVKKPSKKKSAKKKTAAKAKKSAVKKKKKKASSKSAGKTVKKKKTAKKKSARKASLGRPKFTGEALLDEVFKQDYHARQIFTFLGVSTLKELEKFGPEEIVNRLSAPLVQTVQQIRNRLADNNRHLAEDIDYALTWKAAHAKKK